MNDNRKAAEKYLLDALAKIDKSGKNVDRYKKLFASMSDKEFNEYVDTIDKGNDVVAFYTANMTDKLKLEDLLKAAKELGVELFERIRVYDNSTDTYYLTPHKCCVIEVPVRRMSQFVDHKISVPEGDSRIDMLTGQVVQEDKAASLSQVEVQTLFARGMKSTILELIKFRGGDVVAFGEYKRELEEIGKSSVTPDGSSIPRSAAVLDVLLSGMQIESNASGV